MTPEKLKEIMDESLVIANEKPSQEDWDATEKSANDIHKFLANLRNLRIRFKKGETGLDNIDFAKNIVVKLLNIEVEHIMGKFEQS